MGPLPAAPIPPQARVLCPDSRSSLLRLMSEPRPHKKTLLTCRRFKQRRFISHLWHGSTSGQVVGGGLPVTGSSGPLADGQEHLGRDKGGVGGLRRQSDSLGSRATSVHGIHTDPTRPLPPGAWGGGFPPAAVMTTIGAGGTVLGAEREQSGGRVEPGWRPRAQDLLESGKWDSGWTAHAASSPGTASPSGLTLGVHPCPGRPPLPSPILLGLPGGQAPLRPGALSGMSDVKDEAHPVARPPRRVYTTCGRANTRQADPKETERTASGGGSYSRGADISTTCTEGGAEINQEQTLVKRPGLGPKNLSKPGSF